jgi:hypothetical protein
MHGALDVRALSSADMAEWVGILKKAAKAKRLDAGDGSAAAAAPAALHVQTGGAGGCAASPVNGGGKTPKKRKMPMLTVQLPGAGNDGRITSYAPYLFRQIRQCFGVDDNMYMGSMGLRQVRGAPTAL